MSKPILSRIHTACGRNKAKCNRTAARMYMRVLTHTKAIRNAHQHIGLMYNLHACTWVRTSLARITQVLTIRILVLCMQLAIHGFSTHQWTAHSPECISRLRIDGLRWSSLCCYLRPVPVSVRSRRWSFSVAKRPLRVVPRP